MTVEILREFQMLFTKNKQSYKVQKMAETTSEIVAKTCFGFLNVINDTMVNLDRIFKSDILRHRRCRKMYLDKLEKLKKQKVLLLLALNDCGIMRKVWPMASIPFFQTFCLRVSA